MLSSLKFVQGAVAKKDFVPALNHFRIEGGRVKGYNGMIALSGPIDLDLSITPKALEFTKAIQACTDTISMHLTPAGRLSIKSGRFKAFVDCIEEPFPGVEPEGAEVKLDGTFLEVIKQLAPFIAEDASRPWARGILFRGSSAFATNNVVLVERWLGYNFPVTINVPKQAVTELLRINEEPERLQVTENNVTFHFSGNRWLRTQTYSLEWPDVSRVLDQPGTPTPPPETLFAAIETLVPFVGELAKIFFMLDGSIATSETEGQGASVKLEPFGAVGAFNIHQFLLLQGVATEIDLTRYPSPCIFYGDRIRGALVGMR